MTLSDLLADLYRRLGYQSTPDSAVTTRLTSFLNQAQRDLLGEPGLDRLQISLWTFASVADTSQYVLTQAASRIHKIYEATNRIALQELSLEAYRQIQPDPTTTTGTPTHYVDLGFSAVSTQPSDASTLYVKSSSASDIAPLTAYIEGTDASRGQQRTSDVLTGTTAVAFPYTWVEVAKFYLSAAPVGAVTLHEDSGDGTELGRIGAGNLNTFVRRRRIALWPTPASAITYSVDYDRDWLDLSASTDEPMLPVRFHPLLIEGALMREMTKKDDARYALAERNYHRMVSNLKYFLHGAADTRPVMGRCVVQRPSTLGGWYPSGT